VAAAGVLLRPGAQPRPPGRALAALDPLAEGGQGRPRVGQDGQVGPHDPTERLRVNVDVDDPRAGREVGRPPHHPVVEAHAHAQDQVGVVQREIGLHGAMHADHAQRLGVLLGEGAQPEQRRADGRAAGLGQRPQLARGVGHGHAVAGHDQRPLGGVQQLGRALDGEQAAAGRQRVVLVLVLILGRRGEGILLRHRQAGRGQLDVLGQVDQHRAGSAGAGDLKGSGEDLGDLLGPGELEGGLGDRADHAHHVDLLEGLGADGGAGHLPGDGHHGHAVHVGGGQAGEQVGGARAAGGDAHAHLAGGAGVAVGGVGGVLLVADQHVAQRRVAHQVAVEGQGGAAGVAEQDVHVLRQQRFAGELGARPGDDRLGWGCWCDQDSAPVLRHERQA
jgi:hypothetical protein